MCYFGTTGERVRKQLRVGGEFPIFAAMLEH